jgi:hypothetical protein
LLISFVLLFIFIVYFYLVQNALYIMTQSYDEDYSETDNDDTGSGDNIPPPPPRPPPTPDGGHDLFNLSGILGSGSEGSQVVF